MKHPICLKNKKKKYSQSEIITNKQLLEETTEQSLYENSSECNCLTNKTFNQNNNTLNNILNELKLLTNKLELETNDDEKESIIKFSAMVIDRFCLLTFTAITFLCTVLILFSSKNFFKFT